MSAQPQALKDANAFPLVARCRKPGVSELRPKPWCGAAALELKPSAGVELVDLRGHLPYGSSSVAPASETPRQ